MITITFQVAAMLALAFLGLLAGFGRMLVASFEKRLDERAAAQNELRAEQIATLKASVDYEGGRVTILSERLDKFTAVLPLEYVRREDWIRFIATIDHKLDRLAEMFLDLRKNS